jgi:DNA-binding SARP family transcriptional activator
MSAVRLLGPVELWNGDTQLPAGPPQQRRVLAVLALAAGRPVPLATLIDRVWGERQPRDARNALYSVTSRLRRPLAGVGGALPWESGCYRLDIDPVKVDLHHARELATRARELGRGSAAEAAALLAQACEQWRGTPLAGLRGDWIDRVREALLQERLALLTERFELDLRCGRHAAAIGPLAGALGEDPLAEPLAALLMRALHGVGRHAEALDVFARIRQRLIQEIGDGPGEALRDLHTRLLRRDPSLAATGVLTAPLDDEIARRQRAEEPERSGRRVLAGGQLADDRWEVRDWRAGRDDRRRSRWARRVGRGCGQA